MQFNIWKAFVTSLGLAFDLIIPGNGRKLGNHISPFKFLGYYKHLYDKF